ncbi:MAG: glycosyltransferase family 9 protein [Candidatus Eisenbacteria bacterium]|nr:glycosyltransferase family 9 protein [Candidatus Eisenbacteria bacterium]
MASPWEKLGKRLLFAPFALAPRRGLEPIRPGYPPARVLIIRPDDRIGNLVLLLPLLDAIHQAWPGVRVDLLLARVSADLIQGDPRVARTIVFDKRRLVENGFRALDLFRELRREPYDLVLDASHPQEFSLTGSLLTVAARARRRVGYLAGSSGRVLDAGLLFQPDPSRHQSEVFLDLLRRLVPGVEGGPLSLPIGLAERDAARQVLIEAGADLGRRWLGIHPGGRGVKRWPIDQFAELIDRLAGHANRQILVFQGPGEEDLVRQIGNCPAVTIPRLPVRPFAAALTHLHLMIAGDTGPMHVAAAVGTPTLALFLSANQGVFGPPGPRNRALYDPRGLPVEVVVEAAESLWESSTPRA